MEQKIPNLFIVGAGKAGTSSVYKNLSMHSEIFMASRKEPNYFGSDLKRRQPTMKRDEYLALFEEGVKCKYRGEASINYLLSKCAGSEIFEFNPDAKIIIMLRDPIQVLHSRHSQNIKVGAETIKDFEKALRMETTRRMSSNIPNGVGFIDDLFYGEWVKYSSQVQRYLDIFGHEKVYIGVYDDLVETPKSFYANLFSFLGLTVEDNAKYVHANKNKALRSVFLARLLRGYLPGTKKVKNIIIPNKRARKWVGKILKSWNEVSTSRAPIDPFFENELRRGFDSEILRLEKIIGRKLTNWRAQ